MEFKCVNDLSIYTDSMLFESGQTIATLIDREHNVTIELRVCGNVNVEYKGTNYFGISEFPDGLVEAIKKDRYFDCNPDIDVRENNWFEYIYYYNGCSDGIMFEADLSKYTVDELKEEMETEILPWILEEKVGE